MWFDFSYPEVKLGDDGSPVADPLIIELMLQYRAWRAFNRDLDNEIELMVYGYQLTSFKSILRREDWSMLRGMLWDAVAIQSHIQGLNKYEFRRMLDNVDLYDLMIASRQNDRSGVWEEFLDISGCWEEFVDRLRGGEKIIRMYFHRWASKKYGPNRAVQEYCCREEHPNLWELLSRGFFTMIEKLDEGTIDGTAIGYRPAQWQPKAEKRKSRSDPDDPTDPRALAKMTKSALIRPRNDGENAVVGPSRRRVPCRDDIDNLMLTNGRGDEALPAEVPLRAEHRYAPGGVLGRLEP